MTDEKIIEVKCEWKPYDDNNPYERREYIRRQIYMKSLHMGQKVK